MNTNISDKHIDELKKFAEQKSNVFDFIDYVKTNNINFKSNTKRINDLIRLTIIHNNIPILNEIFKLGGTQSLFFKNETSSNNAENLAFIAVMNSNLFMLHFLRINGVSMMDVDQNNNTLIHHALLNDNTIEIIDYLLNLENEIDINAKNNKEQTHLDIINDKLRTDPANDKYLSLRTKIKLHMYKNKYQDECYLKYLDKAINDPTLFFKSDNINKFPNNKITVSNCNKIEMKEYYNRILNNTDKFKLQDTYKYKVQELGPYYNYETDSIEKETIHDFYNRIFKKMENDPLNTQNQHYSFFGINDTTYSINTQNKEQTQNKNQIQEHLLLGKLSDNNDYFLIPKNNKLYYIYNKLKDPIHYISNFIFSEQEDIATEEEEVYTEGEENEELVKNVEGFRDVEQFKDFKDIKIVPNTIEGFYNSIFNARLNQSKFTNKNEILNIKKTKHIILITIIIISLILLLNYKYKINSKN
jgi:hypothetical protein